MTTRGVIVAQRERANPGVAEAQARSAAHVGAILG